MGFWDGLRDGWDRASTARQAEAEALGAAISRKAEQAGGAIGGARPIKGAYNATKSGVKGVFSAGRKAVKIGTIGAVLAAGAAAVGIMANRSRKAAAGAAQDDIANAPNTVDVPEAVIPQMMPAQDTGPAEGRKEGEWVNRVAADRGGLAPQNPAAQPKMSVVPEASVTDLGSSAPTQPTR